MKRFTSTLASFALWVLMPLAIGIVWIVAVLGFGVMVLGLCIHRALIGPKRRVTP